MGIYKILPCCVLLLFIVVCNRPIPIDEVVTAKKVIRVQATELRDKEEKGKYNVRLNVTNLSKDDIIIQMNDILCFKEKRQGRTEHAFFQAGERVMDFVPGQMKNYHFVCALGSPVVGNEYTINFTRVFNNPSHDRRTPGEIIGKDIKVQIRIKK